MSFERRQALRCNLPHSHFGYSSTVSAYLVAIHANECEIINFLHAHLFLAFFSFSVPLFTVTEPGKINQTDCDEWRIFN